MSNLSKRKSFTRTIECTFPRRCSFPGCQVMCRFVENVEKGKIYLWWPLVTWHLTWPKKDRSSFVKIFYALSNATYHVSLHGPGAELEEGCSNTPPAHTQSCLQFYDRLCLLVTSLTSFGMLFWCCLFSRFQGKWHNSNIALPIHSWQSSHLYMSLCLIKWKLQNTTLHVVTLTSNLVLGVSGLKKKKRLVNW